MQAGWPARRAPILTALALPSASLWAALGSSDLGLDARWLEAVAGTQVTKPSALFPPPGRPAAVARDVVISKHASRS
jgi:hypothetical protein